MKRMRTLLVPFVVLVMMVVAGCIQPAEKTPKTEDMPAKHPELSAEEAGKYKSSLPAEEKMMMAKKLMKEMPGNGMVQMKALYPDLKKVKDIAADGAENLMNMGTESWHYTKEGDMTIAVCDMVNTPFYIFKGNAPSKEMLEMAAKDVKRMMEDMDKADHSDDDMMDADADMAKKGGEATTEGEAPQYVKFDKDLYQKHKGKKALVIYFHADWCPVCRALEKNITTDLKNFPKGTLIMEANFDKEDVLKKEFGITTQSSFVVLDSKGEVYGKFSAPNNDTLKDAITKSME